jgi:anaerobic ribonucleoside-triphosphate reductase
LEDGKCPKCKDDAQLRKMCERDVDYCGHVENQASIKLCDVCGEVICPTCGSHYSHFGISRVTGYLSEINGWGAGKRAELKDRMHYDVGVS